MNPRAAVLLPLLPLAAALDCSSDPLLQDYDFEKYMAAPYTNKLEIQKETPPSRSTTSWTFNLCGNRELPRECEDDDLVCGTQKINFAKDTRLAQVIEFSQDSQTEFSNEDGLKLTIDGAKWGTTDISAEIRFECAAPEEDEIVLESWDEQRLAIRWKTAAGCTRDQVPEEKEPEKKKENKSESWGWFTWLFIYVVLALAIYIIASAWAQSNGDLRYIASDSAERAVALARSVPEYVRDVFNSSRGGYSAV